jgi:hypothetical protein
LQPLRFLPLGPRLATDWRHAGQHVEDVRHLIDVSRRYRRRQRNALGIGQHVVLATGFAAIRGVRAGILASLGGLGEGGVDQAPPPIDLVGPIEFGE